MKLQFIRLTMLSAVALFIAACGAMETQEHGSAGDDMARFEQVYQQAEAAWNKAAAVGGGWRDTQDFLKEAKEAASKADFKKAISLAEYARFEGEAAFSQYQSQRKAGPYLF
jgi:hypothetical protein